MTTDAGEPEFVFAKADLIDLKDASESLATFIGLVERHKVIRVNMKNVDSLTADFADHFFGPAALQCVVNGAKMNMHYRNSDEVSKAIVSTVNHSIKKFLPVTLGGSATVH